ncbi:hypothetical protein D7X48_21580 [bacterium D16-50]|nr:hypothetical protein D7X48_21580 [bacterium D16-50]
MENKGGKWRGRSFSQGNLYLPFIAALNLSTALSLPWPPYAARGIPMLMAKSRTRQHRSAPTG